MKRILVLGLVIVLVSVACLAGCSGGQKTQPSEPSKKAEEQPAAQKPVELKMATIYGPTHTGLTRILQPWAEEVGKATNGRVKVMVYPVDTLLKATDVYEGVVGGIADIGQSDVGYNPGRFPLLSAYFLGGIEYANSKVATYVAWDMVSKMGLEETKGAKFQFVYGLTPSVLMTKKPVRTLEDLKGMRVRVTGFAELTMRTLGATPVAMPMSEAYEAFSKGMLDACLVPAEALKTWNLAEVVKYVTVAPFLSCAFHYVAMNNKAWDAISPADKQAIEEVNKRTLEAVSSAWDQLSGEGTEFAKSKGVQVVTLTPEEKARWMGILKSSQEDWIKKVESQGLKGRQVVEELKRIAEEYNKKYGS